MEFFVEDAHPIVMRRVVRALLGVFPDRAAVPVHFLETLKTTRIILRRVEDIPVFQQMRIRADGPGVNHAALQVQEVSPVADAEQRVAGLCLVCVAEKQLRRALQTFVGECRIGDENQQ